MNDEAGESFKSSARAECEKRELLQKADSALASALANTWVPKARVG
jgi:hypothetical protein